LLIEYSVCFFGSNQPVGVSPASRVSAFVTRRKHSAFAPGTARTESMLSSSADCNRSSWFCHWSRIARFVQE